MTARRGAGLALALAVALAGVARADDAPEERELDQARVDKAIERGVAWLKKQQKEDGRYDDGYAQEYPLGPTALAALALAKCVGPNDPAAAKAFAALTAKDIKKTYDVGILLMAIEAGYAPRDEDLEASNYTYAQLVRRAFARAAPIHQRLVQSAADFLVRTQRKEVWAYPEIQEDHSNTQYALLGIGAARRLGLSVPIAGLQRALDHFLRVQEADGPEVEAFVVPAADHTVKEIEALAADLHKPRVREEGGHTEIRKFYETAVREKMKARGFSYRWAEDDGGQGGGQGGGGRGQGGGGRGRGGWGRGGRMNSPNLSMTTAGLASLVTLKWALEGTPGYPAKKTDQAIRDSAAYIAHNWQLGSSEEHDYYILYGIERAGAMTGCPFFGKHDWYVEGGEWILDHQSDDGSWGRPGPVSGRGAAETSLPDTCFALLFLGRGSVPVVPPIPKRIVSGLR